MAWYVGLGYRLNINRAQTQDLQALPHIGPQTARAIVGFRAQHGPFACVEALGAVAGVGPGTVARLRPFVTVANGG
jgi:competence protein ComEA